MKNKLPDFFIIDDDALNNTICTKVIKQILPEAIVCSYLKPQKALDFFKLYYNDENANDAVLFLDINMPMDGWYVLERFNEFTVNLKEHFTIYLLTSSVDVRDMEKAKVNTLVSKYISKPLTLSIFYNLINKIENNYHVK